MEEPDTAPDALAQKLNLIQETDEAFIEQLVMRPRRHSPDKMGRVPQWKKGLIGLFMGEVMKRAGKQIQRLPPPCCKNWKHENRPYSSQLQPYG